jgi:hypothetical protein
MGKLQINSLIRIEFPERKKENQQLRTAFPHRKKKNGQLLRTVFSHI